MRLGTLSACSLAVCLYLSIASFSLNKPLTLDQAMPFAWNAGAIHHYGWDILGSKEEAYEIAHPVLYHHILAMSYSIFGETTVATRLVGVICFVAVLVLMLWLSKILYPGKQGIWIGGLAALLYAVNPFTVQYSLLVDHDTTILPVSLLLFFCYFFRNPDLTPLAIAKLSGLLALSLWAKDLTPYFAVLALFLFLWLRGGTFTYAAAVTACIGVCGTVIFAATWAVYCLATGVPILSFIEFSILNKALNPAFHQTRSLSRLLWGFAWSSGMVTPAVLIMLVSAALDRAKQYYRWGFEVRLTDYLWLYIVLLGIVTNLHIQHPKYQYPIYSVAFVLIAEYVYNSLIRTSTREIMIAIGLGLLCAVVLAFSLGDPILMAPREYVAYVFALPLIILLGVFLARKKQTTEVRSRFVLGMVGFLLATNVSLTVKQTGAYTTATSWGEYGERGFDQTLKYLRANLNGSVPVVRKDFGYYLTIAQPNRQFTWIYNAIFRGNLNDPVRASQIARTISRDDIQLVVLDRYTNRAEGEKALLRSSFELVHQFGDFDVFRKVH